MRPTRLALALALVLFALPLSALAQDGPAAADEAPAVEEEESSPLTWNLTLTSDYVFRGITQTDFKPAVQGGLDYSWGSGIYVGFWASNVDFADSDGPDIELDTYVGWNHDLSDQWNLDLSLVHYAYLGSDDAYGDIDYNEVIGALTWNEMLTLNVGYAPDYSNLDFSSTWVNLTGSWELGNEISLNAGIGHSNFSDGNGSYNDWNIGISRPFGPATAAINYYDTDIDDDNTSDTIVFSIAFGNE